MKQKVETLQADLSRRQESYIRRERAFNMRIEELEEEVGSLKVRCTARLHWALASTMRLDTSACGTGWGPVGPTSFTVSQTLQCKAFHQTNAASLLVIASAMRKVGGKSITQRA